MVAEALKKFAAAEKWYSVLDCGHIEIRLKNADKLLFSYEELGPAHPGISMTLNEMTLDKFIFYPSNGIKKVRCWRGGANFLFAI